MAKKPTYEAAKERGRNLEEKAHTENPDGEELQLFKAIVEASSEAIAISDPEGRLIYVNPAHERLFDRSLEEAQELNYRDYYPPESVDILNREVAPALERGKSWEGVLRAQDRHGRCFPLWERADTLCDESGRMLYGFGIMHDISEQEQAEEALREAHKGLELRVQERTAELLAANKKLKKEVQERKQAEEALRGGEERFRTLFQNVPDPIFILDGKDGQIFNANEAAFEQYGYGREEMIGLRPQDIDTFEQGVHVEKRLAEIQKRGRLVFETEHRKADGDVFPVEVHCRLLDFRGEPTFLTVCRDISERRQAETERRESEEKYRLLAEDSLTGVFIHQDGKYVFVNQRFADIHGYTRGELVGKDALMLIHRDDRSFAEEMLSTRLKGESAPERYEIRRLRKDEKTVWCEMMANRVDYGGNPAIMGNVIDITGRKRLEAQLRQAHKMEAIGTLAGGVAHDFNNILGIVLGNTELALDDIPDSYPVTHNLKEIRQACLRAKDLVKQILAFSRQAAQEQRPVHLGPIIKEALDLLRCTIPTTIDIRQHISVAADTVLADSTQIHQVLINLCTNAAQAMSEEGGVLEVSLKDLHPDEEGATEHPHQKPGDHVILTVKDTGHGVDPSIAERIFEPYFTTKEVGQGSGMGLAVAHGIVRSHGGAITLESVPGRGATFRVLLPRVEGEAEPDALSSEAIVGGRERILFVDDEASLVGLARTMLKRMGYDVVTARGSLEALDVFRNGPDRFDLVITDMTMPHMTGDRLAEELMRIRPDIRVVLCTGHSERINEEKARAMGICDFLLKPILRSEVAKTIRRVLDE
ncbi:MAG: PAS domain S-box protein [Thermodesulfobacteriota bacterium]|nr:PAS domain S-box protein [Thermodesulfobacteriota bacterium]